MALTREVNGAKGRQICRPFFCLDMGPMALYRIRMVKMHKAVKGTVADPEAFRSLCGRSSGRVWRVSTLENGQNLNDEGEQVTCKFCLQILKAKAQLTNRRT
jgi:hypothetical protein